MPDDITLQNIPAHVTEDRVFDFNIYGDPRLTEDLHDSYATLGYSLGTRIYSRS